MGDTTSRILITAQDQTQAAFRSVERGIGDLTKSMSGMMGGLTALTSVAGIGYLINRSMESADALSKLSKTVGISTTSIQELQFAAVQSGGSVEGFTTSLNKFTQITGDAVRGGKGAQEAFAAIGVSLDDLSRLDQEALLEKTLAGLGSMDDAARRASIAVDLFGSGALAEMGEFITSSADEMVRMRKEAHDLGGVMDKETVANMKRANDEFSKAEKIIGAQLTTALADVAPLLIGLAKGAAAVARAFRWMWEAITPDDRIERLNELNDELKSIAGRTDRGAEIRRQGLINEIKSLGDEIVAMKEVTGKLDASPAARVVEPPGGETKKNKEKEKSKSELFGPDRETLFKARNEYEERLKREQERIAELAAIKEEMYARDNAQMMESAFTEAELDEQRYADKLGRLRDHRDQGFIDDAEYAKQRVALEAAHQSSMKTVTIGGLIDRLGAVANHSRAGFRLYKTLALAQAAITLPSMVMTAYKDGLMAGGPFGPAVGAAYAGLALATGLLQIRAISSASFGGSPSAAGVSGGGSVPSIYSPGGGGAGSFGGDERAPIKQSKTVNVTLIGSSYSAQSVRDLIDLLNEQIADGATLNIGVTHA